MQPINLRRRALLSAGALLSVSPFAALPARARCMDELTLSEALERRQSVRTFAAEAPDPALVAELLWSAFGINRPATGLRTAPSWHGATETVVHVASKDGVAVYDPATNATVARLDRDIRPKLSPQPFVATAPICLIHVADLRRLAAADQDDQKRHWAQVDAALVAQNVYLFCASRGLGTCLVGGLDGAAITAELALEPHEFATFVQPVGIPA